MYRQRHGLAQLVERLNTEREVPGGVLGVFFARYVPLASNSPYPITVYSVASYRLHLSHFWTNM